MTSKVKLIDPYIRVKNVARSADWYRRMLGLTVGMAIPNRKKPAFVRLNGGDPRGFALMIGDGSDAMSDKKAPKSVTDAISARKAQRVVSLYVTVDKDVDGLYRSMKRRRVKIDSAPTSMPYGMREFHVRDPDGYEVAIAREIRTRPPRRRAPARRRPAAAKRPAATRARRRG